MTSEFIPYDLALRLKALGFDEPCMASRDMGNGNGLIQIPIYQQAFRWFRNVENGSYNHLDFMYEYLKDESITYEEAELACLIKLIEIVESKQK
jgi:hypothetical protein